MPAVIDQTSAELADVTQQIVGDGYAELRLGNSPLRPLADDFRASINESLAACAQLEQDFAELRERRDLVPQAGLERLHAEAVAEARSKGTNALAHAGAALENLQRGALLLAMPKPDPSREELGRDELALLVTGTDPATVMVQVDAVAHRGSRDAVAALGSSFGRSLLESRGLTGRDLDETITAARRTVAAAALERPARHTQTEIHAAKVYAGAGRLGAAIGGASTYLRTLTGA